MPGGVAGAQPGVVAALALRPGVVEAAQRLGRHALLAVQRLLVGHRDEPERQHDALLVVAQQNLGVVLLRGLCPQIGEEGVLGQQGMTDCTPADFRRSTANWASELVLAVASIGGHGDHLGRDPRLLQVGQQVVVQGGLVAGPVPTTTPTFLAPPMRCELEPHCTVAARMAASSGPVHHR